jgi:hypothetical protein
MRNIKYRKGNYMQAEVVKLVVYVPETHANTVREALGAAGAGKVGDYSHCSFSVKGTGRFLPLETARPAVGRIGELTAVVEERIETVCYRKEVERIIAAVKAVHPYEEVAIDVYPLVLNPHETTKRGIRKG